MNVMNAAPTQEILALVEFLFIFFFYLFTYFSAPTTPPPTTTPPPPTCISGGHTGCCTRTPGNSCSVSNDGMSCYCDQGCHERDECCSDIGNTCPGRVFIYLFIF